MVPDIEWAKRTAEQPRDAWARRDTEAVAQRSHEDTGDGRHKDTGRFVIYSGLEKRDFDDELQVSKSLGRSDVSDDHRQVAG